MIKLPNYSALKAESKESTFDSLCGIIGRELLKIITFSSAIDCCSCDKGYQEITVTMN